LVSISGVIHLRTLALRPWLAAVLVLALSVAGVGRGWAATLGSVEAAPVIAGVVAHICHDAADGGGSDNAGQHDCCDACALCAPVMLPGTPDLTAPARVIQFVAHADALHWAPSFGRPRTPRLAQGPPIA
jgi:hypothetical protein